MIHSLAIKSGEPGFDLVIGVCFGAGLLLCVGAFLAARTLDRESRARKKGQRKFEVKLTGRNEPETKKDELQNHPSD